MSRIFISYKHIAPDQELAAFLRLHFEQRGHTVFLDAQLGVGDRWVTEIETHIRTADYFVVLLSQASIRSEMVKQEIKFAYECSKTARSPTLLPVRLTFRGDLPYDVAAHLYGIQYASWDEGMAFETIGEQLVSAVETRIALPEEDASGEHDFSDSGIRDLAAEDAAPLPQMDPRLTGAVRPDSPYYIERAADRGVLNQVRGTGTTTIIKGARQIGKSSLLARANAAAKEQQRKVFYLDFQQVDDKLLESLEALFRYVAYKIERAFRTTFKSRERWDEDLGAKDNLTDFVEEAVLFEAEAPVVFLLDEVDKVFDCTYRADFFSTLRAWHNRRAIENAWNRFNLVIAHSTDAHLWIDNLDESPFNVGWRVELEDFTETEVFALNAKHGSPLRTEKAIRALMDLVGGHPYLVRTALYSLSANKWSLEQLQAVAVTEQGPYGDHLRHYRWRLQQRKVLKQALDEIIRHGACDSEDHFQRLRAGGLVKGTSRHTVRIRCRLYEDYFKGRL